MAQAPLETIHEVRLKEIEISDDNVRESGASTDLAELASSIRLHGLLQPVVLKGTPGHPPYELIGGQRRFLAHEQLGRKTIRAVFAGGALTKTDVLIRSLVENLQRVELEYADTARAVTYLYKELGNDREVSKATGLSLQRVRTFIEVEERATKKMKTLLKNKKVTLTDVKRAIRASQDNLSKAEELLDLMVEQDLTTHQKKRLVEYGKQNKGASAQKIVKEALKPRIEQNLIISLPSDLIAALTKATKSLDIDADELALQVLGEWLKTQGFSS